MKNRSSVRSARAVAPAALLFFLCLLIPGSAALSQPFPSFMLDSTIVRGPTFGSVEYSAVAFGPDVGLVVWVEDDVALLGARIDRNGVLLDSAPIDIPGPDDAPFVNMRPAVAWGGQRFLVVWTGGNARCALVDENGSVTERRVLQDDLAASQSTSAAAAFDGTNFLATWVGYSNSYPLPGAFFARVSTQGVVLDSPPVRVAPKATIEQNDVAVCFHNNKYLAVWTVWDTSGVWGNFILPDGTTPDSVGFPIKRGINSDCPSVTHDRHNFIIGWYEHLYKTRLARVSDGGQVLDTVGVLIDSTAVSENAVFSSGDTTLVVDIRNSSFGLDSAIPMAIRVDTALRLIDSTDILLSWPNNAGEGDPRFPAIALCGDDYIVTWNQEGRIGSGISNSVAWYRRLSRQGELVDSAPVLASCGANKQLPARLASDGNDFLTAWADSRYDSTGLVQSIYAVRLTNDGSIQAPVYVGSGTYPDVTYGGGCYLVVWRKESNALAARISRDGMLLDSVPVALDGSDGVLLRPAVAYGDSVFLVVWKAASDYNIHGTRLTPAGTLLDSAPRLLQANATIRSYDPEVAFDGHNFLVVRNDRSTYPGTFYGTRVDIAGEVFDPDDIAIGNSAIGSDAPRLAFGGGVYLMTSTNQHISWRISPEGQVLGDVTHRGRGALLAGFNGSDFVLACRGDSVGELASVRITPDGLLDSTPVLLARTHSSAVSVSSASLAANGTGVTGLVFGSHERSPWLVGRVRAAVFPTLCIGSQREVAQPIAFHIQPNPASRLASLTFNLPQTGPVRVTAFDAAGRKAANLYSGPVKAGPQTLPLDTRRLANGVYFLRLEAGTERLSTRMVVSR